MRQLCRTLLRGALALAIAAGAVAPAGATTLIRQSLDELVAHNKTIVLGEVLDASSYWNAEGSFILTDVHVLVREVLKGKKQDGEITVTLLGGSVGELTAVIIGGPQLVPGNAYVLFLGKSDLPGAAAVRTVPDLCQGAFDVVMGAGGLRAVSQANGEPLVPDAVGYVDAPGGTEGFPLDAMMRSIREIAARGQGGGEVKK